MKNEDVRIGMKVVPHQKTVKAWGDLEDSYCWKVAKDDGQNFMYVTGWDEEDNCFLLSNNQRDIESENNELDGDFFNPEDFEPYLEELSSGEEQN